MFAGHCIFFFGWKKVLLFGANQSELLSCSGREKKTPGDFSPTKLGSYFPQFSQVSLKSCQGVSFKKQVQWKLSLLNPGISQPLCCPFEKKEVTWTPLIPVNRTWLGAGFLLETHLPLLQNLKMSFYFCIYSVQLSHPVCIYLWKKKKSVPFFWKNYLIISWSQKKALCIFTQMQ